MDALKSFEPTSFPAQARVHQVKLVLGGDMARYVWHINGKGIHEERTIEIQEGDVIRFQFVNKTMMHHPMHLHGHFFRVLNDGGDRSPLKHTVDVGPHSSRTIEFLANEPGEWMLHCHNLYHLKTGMAGRQIFAFRPQTRASSTVQADVIIDHRGDTRLDLGKEFQWTKYVMSDMEARFREKQKTEWKVSLMYAPAWSAAMGLVFTEDGPGVGLRYQF